MTTVKRGQTVFYKGREAIFEGRDARSGMLLVKLPKVGIITAKAGDIKTTKGTLTESVFMAPIAVAKPKSFDLMPSDIGFDDIVSVREADEDEKKDEAEPSEPSEKTGDAKDGDSSFAKTDGPGWVPSPSKTVASAAPAAGPTNIAPLTTEPGAQEGGHIDIDMQKMPGDAPVIPDPQADDSGNSRPIAMSADMDAGKGGDGETKDGKFTDTDGKAGGTSEEPKEPKAEKEQTTESNTKDVASANLKKSMAGRPGAKKPNKYVEALNAVCKARGRALSEEEGAEHGTITLTMEAAMVVMGSIAEKKPSIELVAKIVEALDHVSGEGQPVTVNDLDRVAAEAKGEAAPDDGEAPAGAPAAPEGGSEPPVAEPTPTDGAPTGEPGTEDGKDMLLSGGSDDSDDPFAESRRPYFGLDDIEKAINESMLTDEQELTRLRRVTGQKDWWKPRS